MLLFAVQKSGKINLDLTIIGLLSHSVIFAFCEEILRPISSSLENMFFGESFTTHTKKGIQCVKAYCHRSVDLAAHRRCVSHVTFYDHASSFTYQSPVLKGTEEGIILPLFTRAEATQWGIILAWFFVESVCKGSGNFWIWVQKKFFLFNYFIYSIMLGKKRCQSKIYIYQYMLNDMVGASKGSCLWEAHLQTEDQPLR